MKKPTKAQIEQAERFSDQLFRIAAGIQLFAGLMKFAATLEKTNRAQAKKSKAVKK